MAEKHKSKYKAPKDLEKSQKPKARKDLKDYTEDDKKGALNPNSTGEKQSNVLRKTDKEVVDTGDIFVKYNADDRLYKDLEDGEYDPKHAAKVLKKRQDADEKDNEKNIKDKIENLTREQHERLVREYIRRKIVKVLNEAEGDEEAEDTADAPAPDAATPTDVPTDVPTDTAATDTSAAPAPAADVPTDTATPPPAAPATPTDIPAPAPTDTPAPAPTDAAPEDAETRQALAIEKFVKHLKDEGGNIARVKSIAKVLNTVFKDVEPEDQQNFYKMLKTFAIKKLTMSQPTQNK